jgi:hypothetical protein
MQKLRMYILPILLALTLGLPACGNRTYNSDLQDSRSVPQDIELHELGLEDE